MSKDNSSRRRTFLKGSAAALAAGLAGCAGGSGGSGGSSDSSSGDSSSGGSSSGGDPMLTDASEFSAANPGWGEHNYLSTALTDAGYQRGSTTDLLSLIQI